VNQLNSTQVEQLKEIGAQLRDLRQSQSLSTDEVAAKTYIPSRLLRALEEGQPDKLPEPIFIQGFIRRYGDALRLDGAALAKTFLTVPAPVEPEPEPSSHDIPVREVSRPRANLARVYVLSILLSVAAIAAGAAGLFYVFHKTRVTLPHVEKQEKPHIPSSIKRNKEAKNLIFSAPKQFQGQAVEQVQLNDASKAIALTFDDGPWPKTTPQVLDILKQEHVKATFFWLGAMVQESPQLAKLAVADGHAIGNHTWHHWYKKLDPATAASEIESTAEQIYKTTGVRTSLFRPPGGILDNGVVDYAKSRHYAVVLWSDDSIDYRSPSVPTLVDNVLRHAKPGAIVLMHDGGGYRPQTVKALPQIISALKEKGYRFMTVPELLATGQRSVTTR
jgi:peptidoglycan/xylan/chitin deacetylase (PgdA/CDA1 family)/transcriptional regulator with XRE-family HTH domain